MSTSANQSEQYHATTDLGEASWLVAAGFSVIDLDRANPGRVKFVFPRSPEVESSSNTYWSDESVRFSPQRYWQAIKSLKSRLHTF